MKGGGEHRRGRSMGSTTPRSDSKDEDLALFHEMKRREKHNFLHPSPDDLDVSLSKKSGIDLLTSDVDKNDYDWLLTPPGTPLFPSLDQEASALAVISPQASLLGSSSANSSKLSHSPADPSPKSTRGNPSPRRSGSTTPNGTMSRSRSTPHNSISVVATVTRPSTPTSSLTRPSTPTAKSSSTTAVRASTPNLKLSISASKSSSSAASTPTGTRPSTPNARSSTPPVRPSTPGARSSTPTSKPSTPTMRRSLSGGKITSSPATTRGGPSPKRTTSSRGNSPAAKRVTPVITTVPGMCSEAPPNLRTTAPERTSSTPKSSSNGTRIVTESGHASDAMDASGRSRRRPRSPSVTRSFSSSSSQDQRTSSQTSRGSVISSYDDGIEVSRPTLQSSRNSAAGKWHAAGHEDLLSGKANTNVQAKRVTKSLVISSSSSVSGGTPTKKSLEPNKWQGEAYQHSPSSYRHLVASSPGSPFYGSRANSLLVRPASAMNSSVTTSSNASSEHGTTVAPDTEGSERDDDDLLSWDSFGRRMSPSPRGQQADILMLDKDDEKLGAWQDYERLNSNDLVASYKPGMQSTLDTEVTSFYESDGMASFEMLEQLGLMGEVYNSKKGTPGERVLERRASNIEDGKAELRRSGEKTLQRRASNIEDSRIPELRRSDDGSGNIRSTKNKLGYDGQSNPGQQGLKSKRQELIESLNDTRKYDGDLLRNSGDKALGSQKNKVSSAEIHAACLFVRDFRVGLAPSQGQETTPPVSHSSSAPEEEVTSTNWVGDGGGSIMSRKDFGDVRQTHDFSQQKLKVSGGGSAFGQMESKLPRRPQSRGKVGNSEPAVSQIQEGSSTADVVQLRTGEDDSVNTSALSVLVDVMERIKHESSQPKYLDLENQVSKTASPTGVVVDDSLRMPCHSQTSEIRRGLSYEEIHAMDEVDTPELHEIEDDSLMYDGGKDELELLESLHRSALRKEEVRAKGEEVFHESPKRRFVMPLEAEMSALEAEELNESPKRRCVQVKGIEGLPIRDSIVLHGSPSFSHEEADVAVTSMSLDDFRTPSKQNELAVKDGDEEDSEILVECRLHFKEQNDGMLPTSKKMDVLSATERETQQSVIDSEVKEAELSWSTGNCAFIEEDLTAVNAVVSVAADLVPDLAVSNNDMDVEEESDGKAGDSLLREVENADIVVVGTSSPSDVNHHVFYEYRKNEKILPEHMDRVVFDDHQCGEATAVIPDVPHRSEETDKGVEATDKHVEAADNPKAESTWSDDADEVSVHGEVGDSSPMFVESAEREDLNEKIPDGKMEENLPLDSLKPRLEGEESLNNMWVETSEFGSRMNEPTLLSFQSAVSSPPGVESTGPEVCECANAAWTVNDVEAYHAEVVVPEILSGATTEKGHQERSVEGAVWESDAGSTAISGKTFVKASEEYEVQVESPVFEMVPDNPDLKECSLRSADDIEDSEEHGAVSDKSREFSSKGIEEPFPGSGYHFAKDLDSSEGDDTISLDSLDHGKFFSGPASELASLSKPDRIVSQFVVPEKLNDGLGHHHLGDSNSPANTETASSRNDFSWEAANHDQNLSQVTGSVLPQSVTDSDVFWSNVSEPSPKHHVIEESQCLEYIDTQSVETSDYYEATSEEKVDSQEVSSGILVERKEVAFDPPNVFSSDGRTGISEVVSKPRSRVSSPFAEMRSASSLCAALEEQLAGLIQKIDSAIEESSKPFISGPQEGMVGRDKLSTRTSELLREQESDESLDPVRSSQEDLLDMLWAEDDDSGDSEGSGEDELSQLHDSKPSGKDGVPNQVSGEIRLSRSSEKGLPLYSNGHPSEASQDMPMVSATVFFEEDGHHMESPINLMETDENVNDVDLTSPGRPPAGALADTTAATPGFDDHGKKAPDNQDCAESSRLNTGSLLKHSMDDDGERDAESRREIYADSMDSSEDERDALVEEVLVTDNISCLHAPVDDNSEHVCGNGSLSSKPSLLPHQPMTVDFQSARGSQRLEEETCTDDYPVGESVSFGVMSSTVKEGEDFVSQNSAGYNNVAEKMSDDPQTEPMRGQEEVDDIELAETDVRSAKVGPSENLLPAGEPVDPRPSEARYFAEEHSGCTDMFTDKAHGLKLGLSAKQDFIQCGLIQSSGGVGDLDEQAPLGESPASRSVGESAELDLVVEGADTLKVPPGEQSLLGEEQGRLQERLLEDKTTLEASEVGRDEESFSGEENDIAECSSQDSKQESSAQLLAPDDDVAGEGCKERIQAENVTEEDSGECVPVVPGSQSPVLSAFSSENPSTETSFTKLDGDENLTSGLQLMSSDDGYLRLDDTSVKEDHEEQQLVREETLPSMSGDSPLPLLVRSASRKEPNESQPVQTFGDQSEEFSDVCTVPSSATDEDLLKEEMLFEIEASEGHVYKETRLSEIAALSGSNLISSENVQSSCDVEKPAVADEEDSYQECISHDSSPLCISRGSLTASSEQETYSAGTQGAGGEQQEETSHMQFSSSTPVGEGFESHSHAVNLLFRSSEDKVIGPEKLGMVEDPETPSSDRRVDLSEVAPSTESNITLQADRVVKVTSNTVAKNSEQDGREEHFHLPIQTTPSEASGNEADTGESHSPQEDGLEIGHRERSLISLGESPAWTGSSDVSKSDEVGSVDSPATEESLESDEVESANLSADKRESQMSPLVSETRVPLSDTEEFKSIKDEAGSGELGGQKKVQSSHGEWDNAESLKQSEKSHVGNGPERLPSSERAWNMTRSCSQREMPPGNGEDPTEKPKEFQENVHLQCPVTGKEEVTRSSFQTEVVDLEVTSVERAAAEAVEPKMKNEGDTPSSETGISDTFIFGDKMNGVGSQSARKLPISKAKSVRTVSLTCISQNELASDGRLSPDGAIAVSRSTTYTSVTVVSPESLQWEPSTTGVPVSGPRETDDSASAGHELGKWSEQGLNSSPTSLRCSLAYMGQQASSFTPIDPCLQSPQTQVFERDVKAPEQSGGIPEEKAATEGMEVPAMRSPPKLMLSPAKESKTMNSPAHPVIGGSSKKDVAPIKAPKAKCSCTIM